MLSDFKVKLIRHDEITELSISKIVYLKKQHWEYSYQSQIEWIKDNIDKNDYHLLLLDNEENLLAYLNLIHIKINHMPMLGIGNVCVDNTVINRGYGTLLINISNFYSKQLSLDLVLLCKDNLIKFYENCGLHLYHNKAYIDDLPLTNNIMFSNKKYQLESEIYLNKLF